LVLLLIEVSDYNAIWSVNEQLNDADIVAMDEKFSEEEIKYVIDHMEKNKVAALMEFLLNFTRCAGVLSSMI
jgi:hypothetical protein